MMFVLYDKESTKYVRQHGEDLDHFASQAAAKAARTRLAKAGKIEADKVEVAEKGYFVANVEKKEMVRNLMSGKEVEQSVNTPRCCDVSSELYWAM
jgi:hypothetical protein